MDNIRIIRFIIVSLLFLPGLFLSHVEANETVDSLVSIGNKYYMDRQYEQASERYNRILQLGFESGEVYYNLGNTFYKLDEFAKAILYYEKALLYNPSDDDIRQNLALANAKIIDKIDVIPDFFLRRWVKGIRGLFSPDQWAVLSFVLFFISLSAFLVFFVIKRQTIRKLGFTMGTVLLILCALSIVFMISRIHSINKHNSAIVLAPSVNVRSSPDEQSTNVFVLHQGTKVMILDSVLNWKEVRISNGNKGWIQKDILGEI